MYNHVFGVLHSLSNTIAQNQFGALMDLGRTWVKTTEVDYSGDLFLPGKDGQTFFNECAKMIVEKVEAKTQHALAKSPVFTFSCDAADTDLAIVCYYFNTSTMLPQCSLLQIAEPQEHDAQGLYKCVEKVRASLQFVLCFGLCLTYIVFVL